MGRNNSAKRFTDKVYLDSREKKTTKTTFVTLFFQK